MAGDSPNVLQENMVRCGVVNVNAGDREGGRDQGLQDQVKPARWVGAWENRETGPNVGKF